MPACIGLQRNFVRMPKVILGIAAIFWKVCI